MLHRYSFVVETNIAKYSLDVNRMTTDLSVAILTNNNLGLSTETPVRMSITI